MLNDTYTLSSALMVYSSGQSKFYIEAHGIKDGVMLEGKPLTIKSIEKLVEAFLNDRKHREFSLFPPNILAASGDKIIWYTPAQQQMLYFTDELNIPDGKAWVPALLWLLNGNRLHIFALNSDNRPDLKTKLFQAPFHNCSLTDGGMCMGSAKLPGNNVPVDKRIQKWEFAFWNSRFSHLIGGSPVKDGFNINLIWKELIETGGKFPLDVLAKFKAYPTLGKLIRQNGNPIS